VRPHLPERKRCIVVLSHDVDRPLDPLDLRPTLKLAAASLFGSARISSAWYGVTALGKGIHSLGTDRSARHWVFEELANEEQRRGFRSTFFLSPTSRFARNGSQFDVEYDIQEPRFRNVSRSLTERGFEIGLHVGYKTGANVRRLQNEKEMLEDVVDAPIFGSRHHYWHLGRPLWPALHAHGQAGLRYDSSTAFDEALGYRLSTALAFHPWNPELERPIDCVQVPTMLMDGAFFYEKGYSIEAALARVEALLDTLKRCEGIAAIDWHQETSLPKSKRFHRWGEAYLALLDLLAADSTVAVQTFAEVIGASTNQTHAS
jgi:hypothetical protein